MIKLFIRKCYHAIDSIQSLKPLSRGLHKLYIVIIKSIKARAAYFRRLIKWLLRDLKNIILYGFHAPFCCETIFVNPDQITDTLADYTEINRKDSGKVLAGHWDQKVVPFHETLKYQFCYSHFVEGNSWEESGAYEFMETLIEERPGSDGCYTPDDVRKRYENLDQLYANAKATKLLLSAKEVNPRNFRESGGVYVHIGRDGRYIFGGGGYHRLAIAQILKLPEIPIQLGVIHKSTIKNWKASVKRNIHPFSVRYWFPFV